MFPTFNVNIFATHPKCTAFYIHHKIRFPCFPSVSCQQRKHVKQKKSRDTHKGKEDRCHWICSCADGIDETSVVSIVCWCGEVHKTSGAGQKVTELPEALKSPRSLCVLFCLDIVLRALTSFCYKNTSVEFWISVAWQYFTSAKLLLSAEGGEGEKK